MTPERRKQRRPQGFAKLASGGARSPGISRSSVRFSVLEMVVLPVAWDVSGSGGSTGAAPEAVQATPTGAANRATLL